MYIIVFNNMKDIGKREMRMKSRIHYTNKRIGDLYGCQVEYTIRYVIQIPGLTGYFLRTGYIIF